MKRYTKRYTYGVKTENGFEPLGEREALVNADIEALSLLGAKVDTVYVRDERRNVTKTIKAGADRWTLVRES